METVKPMHTHTPMASLVGYRQHGRAVAFLWEQYNWEAMPSVCTQISASSLCEPPVKPVPKKHLCPVSSHCFHTITRPNLIPDLSYSCI